MVICNFLSSIGLYLIAVLKKIHYRSAIFARILVNKKTYRLFKSLLARAVYKNFASIRNKS